MSGSEKPGENDHYDVVIVGGGMAGLIAAYDLRHKSVLLLEASDRPGGRVYSRPVGDSWLNFGAHMFGDPSTAIGRLVAELDIPSRPIAGRLMGMSYKGVRLFRALPELYPFLLPLGLCSRFNFIRMGLALRLGLRDRARAMRKALRQGDGQAVPVSFGNDRSLAQLVGPLDPETTSIFSAITERNGADPKQMSAGHGLRSFANVWSKGAPGHNIVGGSGLVPQALCAELGDACQLGCTVSSVVQADDRATTTYEANGIVNTVTSKAVIVATPAFVTHRIVRDLPPGVSSALEKVRYGAYLCAGVIIRRKGLRPWSGTYATATPGRSFSILFNMSTTVANDPERETDSLMLFRGAAGAQDLLALSDDEIEQRFRNDLLTEFPEVGDDIVTMMVQRWPHGAPYSFPGRDALNEELAKPLGRIALAGDYLDFPNMEAALFTARAAVKRVKSYCDE